MNELQTELLESLSREIEANNIAVAENDTDVFVALAKRFPCRTSGIQWELVSMRKSMPSHGKAPPIDEYLPAILKFLMEFAVDARISANDIVCVVGDGVTDVAFHLQFEVLLNCARSFFELPQHTYVTRLDYSWCFCYTFEDDMYYGKCNSK